MSLFSVSMPSPKPQLVEALKGQVEKHYLVHDRLLTVRSQRPTVLNQQIARRIGLERQNPMKRSAVIT